MRRPRDTDTAAASVIGVILMVAVTVILATVISVFVFGVGEATDDVAPQAEFIFEYNESTGAVTVLHRNGDRLDGSQLRFDGAATEKTAFGGIDEWNGTEVMAGDSATVNVTAGETLRVIWRNDEEDFSAVLARYEVPEGTGTGGTDGTGTGGTGDTGATGAISTVTADASADVVYVDISTLEAGSSPAELVVENTETGDTAVTSVSSTGTETLDLAVAGGDTVRATLYETSARTTRLDRQSDTAATASISNVTKISQSGRITRVEFDLDAFANAGGSVYVVAEIVDQDIAENETFPTTGENKSISFPRDEDQGGVTPGDTVRVTVYETSRKRNELATGTDEGA